MSEPRLDLVEVDMAELQALKEEFDRKGYVRVRQALPTEVVLNLVQTIDELRLTLSEHPHASKVANGLNVRPVIDKHKVFRELLITPRTFAAVAYLLGHYSIQLQQSNLIEAYRSGETRLTGWHSDGGVPTIGVGGVRAFGSLKVAYFLKDLLEENMGNLMLVPGSHQVAGGPAFDGIDPVAAEVMKVAAGDAVIFQQGVWHASAPNFTDQARMALYYGYSYRILRPVDYQRMPESVLAHCSPVERQLLGETITHQGYYVPTDDDVPLKPWFEQHFGKPADRGELDHVGKVSLLDTTL